MKTTETYTGDIKSISGVGKVTLDMVDELGKEAMFKVAAHELAGYGVPLELGQRLTMRRTTEIWPEPRPRWWRRLARILPGRRG